MDRLFVPSQRPKLGSFAKCHIQQVGKNFVNSWKPCHLQRALATSKCSTAITSEQSIFRNSCSFGIKTRASPEHFWRSSLQSKRFLQGFAESQGLSSRDLDWWLRANWWGRKSSVRETSSELNLDCFGGKSKSQGPWKLWETDPEQWNTERSVRTSRLRPYLKTFGAVSDELKRKFEAVETNFGQFGQKSTDHREIWFTGGDWLDCFGFGSKSLLLFGKKFIIIQIASVVLKNNSGKEERILKLRNSAGLTEWKGAGN